MLETFENLVKCLLFLKPVFQVSFIDSLTSLNS